MTPVVVLCALSLPLAAAAGNSEPAVAESLPRLTTVAAVRELGAEQARRAYPVKIRGVVTLRGPFLLMYVQDASGGIYVMPNGLPAGKPEPGTEVEIEGVTTFGRFSPSICGRDNKPVKVRTIGKAPLPAPLRLSIDQLADPRYQNQWIELGGVVRSVQSQEFYGGQLEGVVITLASSNQRMASVVLRRQSEGHSPGDNLVGAEVRVRGVYGAVFSDQGRFLGMRLWLSSFESIEVERPEIEEPFNRPLRPVGSLLGFDVHQSPLDRIHMAGVVTQVVADQGFYMEDDAAGLLVRTVESPTVQPGDDVEVAGFPALGSWNPILEDAIVRQRSSKAPPEPITITPAAAASGKYDARLVRMDGLLLEASRGAEDQILALRVADTIVLARLPKDVPLQDLRGGSLLRLTGICVNRRNPDFLRELAMHIAQRMEPESFHMLLSSPAQIEVLRRPSWWTVSRVLAVLAVVLAVTAAALVWVALLRGQVRSQMAIILRQSQQVATHAERSRIAHELHDTLEQELAGIGLQLDTASAKWSESPELARQTLETARALLRHSRTEARRAILDLRDSALERGDLISALREAAVIIGTGLPAHISIQVEGPPRRLPAGTESHLLRIAQEAMANAIKHGRPEKVAVLLAFAPDCMVLRIRDDGVGFDTAGATALDARHFGLLGMRQRAEKMGAALSIDSQPGHGTEICVEVQTEGGRV
jgi:signal transduction histidine kinase